ncbi:MAG TPA: SLC13 family permease [Steroidobacteraceae bacterium]|nr:SLC13 family permease [Steroidobacteraceae bacterium]
MTGAIASLIALLTAIVISMVSRINVGLLAIAGAWLIGVYVVGLKADAVLAGFPSGLFLTLVGVTLLFSIAEVNRSFEGVASRAFRLARGSVRILPLIFFVLGFFFAAIGPGAVPGVALVIPLAMVLGSRARIPPLLTALMVANGANAGNLSPISAVGIIANSRMAAAGIGGHEWTVMLANLFAHAFVAVLAYVFYLFWIRSQPMQKVAIETNPEPFERAQVWTLSVLALWVIGVVVFKMNVGLSAFAAALVLIIVRAGDELAAIKKMPWGIILMVTGVSVLIAILEASGGMKLFTQMLAAIATPSTVNGVIAFVTGAISTYSSTSGVVLPAFLPTVPGLVEQLGGGDPLAISLSINVGSSLVDVSPLSTIGALCVAAVSDPAVSRKLFYQLLIWGLAMTVVGSMLCQMFAGMMARGG